MDNLTPFKIWCYKVLPLVYDDSLSYYEVLCKLVDKVNDVISVTNQIPDAIANSFKDIDTINSVLQKIFSDIKNSISTNDEMSSTTVTTNYKAGDLVWQNDRLYRVLKNVEAGDRWVYGTNYTSVTIEEMNKQLTDRFNAEVTNRENADTALQNNFDAEATARQSADNTLQGNINSEAATRASADSNLQSQINQIIAPSGEAPSEAEVQNARIGADGVTYQTLGDAIRTNDSNLKNQIDKDSDIISANLMGIDVQENLYPGAADWSGTWLNSDTANAAVSNEKFQGYPCVYSSEPWRKYCKNIPVEAGKTYTFEAWIKHAQVGAVFIYLLSDGITTNPATISKKSFKQWNDTPANTWTKLSYTFSVTASGNVSPLAYSGKSAFYIAKYNLVEGDSVFRLDADLSAKATKEDISGIGDYKKYSFALGSSTGSYWNAYIDKDISAGDKIRFIFDNYSGSSALSYVRLDGLRSDNQYEIIGIIDNPTRNGNVETYARNNYTKLRVQFSRVTDESNVTGSVLIATTRNLGITNDLLTMMTHNVYHVEKDGSGDFTSFVEAINVACQHMDSIVYVGAGTWDIVSELGDAYINSVSTTQRGLVLKNRVHVICSSEALITCNYTGTREDTINWLSAFNAGEYGFTLENARIESSKCRYSIHDERGTSEDQYNNKYINCNIKHDNTNGGYGQCIGGGLGKDGHIIISGCVFENPNMSDSDIVSYHNTWYAGGTGKSTVEIVGNYFKGSTTFRASWFGASQEISEFLVHDNSIGYPLIHRVENQKMMDDNPTWIQNTELLEWNNIVRA